MGDIIVKDESLGRSYSFTPTAEGYRQAQAQIDSIKQQNHAVGGEIGRVESYTGGSPSSGTFPFF